MVIELGLPQVAPTTFADFIYDKETELTIAPFTHWNNHVTSLAF
jgi:hypothetical protein